MIRPHYIVHYALGPPFRSMMDLTADERAAVLRAGTVDLPARYGDPRYVDTRRRVEQEMLRQFRETGGRPLRRHPHYALMGRSAKSERLGAPGRRAYILNFAHLAADHTSFTWGDSFRLDGEYRRLTGEDHPASGRVYRLRELNNILEHWAHTVTRPAWQELEFQLWYDPDPSSYSLINTMHLDLASLV